MRAKILLHTLAALLLTLAMLLGALPAMAQVGPAPLTIPNVTLSPGGFLWAVVRQPNGGTVFSGYFTSVNGVPRGHIARLLPNGALDTDWNPSANAVVLALAVDSTGAIYAGGGFDVIGGRGRSMVGKLAGSGSGAADPNWNADVRSTVGGAVETLTLDNAAGALYVGGGFTSVGGVNRFSIAKVSTSGTGAVDTAWNPNPSWTIHSLVADGAGSVYVGGEFTQIGGLPRGYIAKLSGSGTGMADVSWNPSANGRVHTLVLDGSGAVYAGGLFTSIGGQTRNHIAKLTAAGTGAADASWNPSADGEVLALAVDGASVYAGGSFANIGGRSRNHLAKLPAGGTGAADADWNPAASDDVHGLAMGDNGAVHVAGMFITIGGEPRDSLAALPATVIWRTLTYTANANGTIRGASPQTVADRGRGSEVTAVGNTGYHFAQWSDGSQGNPRTDTNVTANLSVSASFALNTYMVTTTASANGTITPSSQMVNHGATTTFTVTPATGYHASASGCGGSLSGTTYTTGPITANCAVSASFTIDTYAVTATAGANGAITPASQTVNHGATTTFTVTPDANYHASVSGCGGSLSGSSYTTGPITGDCAVSASFEFNTWTVTAAAGANGAITPSSQTVDHGATTAFTVTPAAGYDASVTGCGGSLADTTYTTGPITANCTVSATFAADPVDLTLTIDAGRDNARYGQVLTYAVTLSNTSINAANPVSIALLLPPQLDAAAAAWTCTNAGAGAQCTASGSGALQDNGVVLPAGRSLTWLVTAPVRLDAPGADIDTTVSASAGAVKVSASDHITLVVHRDGFEANGDGAQGDDVGNFAACPPDSGSATIDDVWTYRFTPPPTVVGLFDTALAARGQHGAGFRVERANLGDTTQLQLIVIAANGHETASAWVAVQDRASLMLAIASTANGQRTLILDGAGALLSVPLPAAVPDVLWIEASAMHDGNCSG